MRKGRLIGKMFWLLFFLPVLFGFAGEENLKMKIREVSLFKNGYAFVVGEVDIPGPGLYSIQNLPLAVYGTLWITPEAGSLKIENIFKEEVPETTVRPIYSILNVLERGQDKTFDIRISGEGWITGEIVGTTGDVYINIKTDKGILVVNRGEITGLKVRNPKDLEDLQKEVKESRNVVKNKIEVSQGKGKLKIRLLSQGLTWAPSYLLDISNPQEAVILCKALVLNTLADIWQAKGNLIAGFPNIAFLSSLDPFSETEVKEDMRPRHINLQNIQTQTQSVNIATNIAAFSEPVDQAAEIETGEMKEDLYFFPIESLSIKDGQKKYIDLFEKKVPCRQGYSWTIENDFDEEYSRFKNPIGTVKSQEVWHILELTNTSGIPWTTAPAMIIVNDKILGQDTLGFTNIANKTNVKITRPLDVTAQQKEMEIERLRDIDPKKYPQYSLRSSYDYDLVTIRGELKVINRKEKPIDITINKLISGEIIEVTNDPKIEKLARELEKENLPHLVKWDVKVAPRQKLVVTYKYKVLIRR